MQTIANELESIRIGDPSHFGSLTLFPLYRTGGHDGDDYLLLEEAVAQGTACITELGEGGSVAELRLENRGEKPVLLFDGEELLGAKQNRTVNLTILAPAKQTIVIPVSCVEAGRWLSQTADFRPAPHVLYSRGRSARVAQVTSSMAEYGTRRSDQGAVWDDIAAKAERMQASSPTQAMAAMYDSHAVSIEAHLRAFAWTEGQSGILFAIGRHAMGLDLLDQPCTMQKLYHKLVRSYALDALESASSTPVSTELAADFLARLAKANLMIQPAVGVGKDVRLTGKALSGAALWAEERYIHVCGFTTNGIPSQSGFHSRISRPARRRSR